MTDDHVQQRLDRVTRLFGIVRGISSAAAGKHIREVERFVVGTQFDEQVEGLGQDLLRPGIGAIDLVDDHDWLQADFQRLFQHEASLGTRAFKRIDQHQGTVGHA